MDDDFFTAVVSGTRAGFKGALTGTGVGGTEAFVDPAFNVGSFD